MLMMKSLAQELAPHHIRVNSIGPGAIKTPINRMAWETPEAEAELLKLIPYKSVGLPEDIAQGRCLVCVGRIRLCDRHYAICRWRDDALSRVCYRRIISSLMYGPLSRITRRRKRGSWNHDHRASRSRINQARGDASPLQQTSLDPRLNPVRFRGGTRPMEFPADKRSQSEAAVIRRICAGENELFVELVQPYQKMAIWQRSLSSRTSTMRRRSPRRRYSRRSRTSPSSAGSAGSVPGSCRLR